jgi:hypothetical protein
MKLPYPQASVRRLQHLSITFHLNQESGRFQSLQT